MQPYVQIKPEADIPCGRSALALHANHAVTFLPYLSLTLIFNPSISLLNLLEFFQVPLLKSIATTVIIHQLPSLAVFETTILKLPTVMPHTSKKRAYPNLDPHTPSRNPKRPRITEISTPSPITTHRTYFPDSSVQATPASSITLVGSPTFTSTSTSSSAFPNEIYRSHPPHAASELSSPVPSSSSTSSSGSRSDSSSDSSSDSESIPNDPAALNRRWLAAETSASSSESSSESDSDSDSQSGSDSSGSRSESSSSASSDSPNEQSEASSSSSSSSNSGSSSDSDSDSEIDSRSSSAPSPPPPYSVTDPHPRSLLSRLSSLLPTLAAANKTLEVERAEGVLWERDIENLGSEEDGRYIEMVRLVRLVTAE